MATDTGIACGAAGAAPAVAGLLCMPNRMMVAAATAVRVGLTRVVALQTSFQFDRKDGRGKCVAAVGKLEIQLDRDFTTIDRRRLEQAVRLMLDQLDG